jgi:hypothetical protein
VLASYHHIIQQAGYTLTSTTSAQKAFNGSTNGAITLAAGTYEFDSVIVLTSLSASSSSFGFALAGTATFTQIWEAQAVKSGSGAPLQSFNTTANTALATASTTNAGVMHLHGTIVVTVSGTIIPQVSLGIATTAAVAAGSYFKIRKISNTSNTTVGNWS